MRKLKIMKQVCLLSIVLIFSVNVFAGDFTNLKYIGFSKDGKYLAFEEIETSSEGSDYERRDTYFIDTAKNTYAAAPSVFEWKDDNPQKMKAILYARYKKDVALKMKRFGIMRGNTGGLVVSHWVYDWSYIKPVESKQRFTQNDGTETTKMMPDYRGGYIPLEGGLNEKIIFNPDPSDFVVNTSEFYELTLNVNQYKGGKNDGRYKMELTLKDNTQHKEMPLRILQKDGDELPESRRQAYAYKVEQVYLYYNKIAVFLNVFSPGFEGSHIGYMVVTGEYYD